MMHERRQPVENRYGVFGPIEGLAEYRQLIGDALATPGAALDDPEVEAKRTKLSLECFVDVCVGDMSRFPYLQPEQRADLQREVELLVAHPGAFEATFYGLLTHDMFKVKQVLASAGLPETVDHDEAWSLRISNLVDELGDPTMPNWTRLPEESRRLLRLVARISSNYPQTLQGQAPPSTLEDLHTAETLVRDIDIAIKMFDIFGALGHKNSDISLTATPGTYGAMQRLNRALRDPSLTTAMQRHDAFLDAELAHFGAPRLVEAGQTALRTVARIGRHLRIEEQPDFDELLRDAAVQPDIVQEILLAELSRLKRSTLADHTPALTRLIKQRHGGPFALAYLAHVLQEAHIADLEARAAGQGGIATVQLYDVVRALHQGTFDPTQQTLRFLPKDNALVAEACVPSLENLDGLPDFDGEMLRGRRIVLLGVGGGSDGVQAAVVGRMIEARYGCEVAAVAAVRKAENRLSSTGRLVGRATKEITPHTLAIGNWRFLEHLPLEGANPRPMFILNSIDSADVTHDVHALLELFGADMGIGVDTGGDSLYGAMHAGFSARLPSDVTPSQDYAVLQSLAVVAAQRPDVPWLSFIVEPGMDSPKNAYAVLKAGGAQRWALSARENSFVREQYAAWRLDGSGSEEGRYAKTSFGWQLALAGKFGVQLLPLPRATVLSVANPWRTYAMITPAMADIAVMALPRHVAAVQQLNLQ